MQWWHWLLPWRWPWFQKRQAAKQAVQDKFQAALTDAQKRHTDLTQAVDKLREGREQRMIASLPPTRLSVKSHPS